ncbi:unnamed protein product [Effrenium voratum]|nr:unnamed protein product [Effrenium voratum]
MAPFNAICWQKRTEAAERKRLTEAKPGPAKFCKMDLTAVIIAQKLKTKSAVMDYAQRRGTEQMQKWVCANQRRLSEHVEDAWEWDGAPKAAAEEAESEWGLVLQAASQTCPKGDDCSYRAAAELFFLANPTVRREELAAALRAVIVEGPSKVHRVPFLIGPSNSGKTTLVQPLESLFGSTRVFHKPPLNSGFPLVNLMKGKRFIFFDDYRPIEYCQSTIDLPTFLSLFQGAWFEIKQSQAFSNGYADYRWQKGVCMTAKDENLWVPYGSIGPEEVAHVQNRLYQFRCTAVLNNLRRTDSCALCFASWLVAGAAAADAGALRARVLVADQEASEQPVIGLAHLLEIAELSDRLGAFEVDCLALGARRVSEFTAEDWRAAPCFKALRPLEQRRLLKAAQAAV